MFACVLLEVLRRRLCAVKRHKWLPSFSGSSVYFPHIIIIIGGSGAVAALVKKKEPPCAVEGAARQRVEPPVGSLLICRTASRLLFAGLEDVKGASVAPRWSWVTAHFFWSWRML